MIEMGGNIFGWGKSRRLTLESRRKYKSKLNILFSSIIMSIYDRHNGDVLGQPRCAWKSRKLILNDILNRALVSIGK